MEYDLVEKGKIDKYWESQWLIGYYSMLPGDQWKHDLAVAERKD